MEPAMYNELTPAERASIREQYRVHQKDMCFYCNSPLTEEPPKEIKSKKVDRRKFPERFFDHPIHLQHDHKTGLTEGAVHAYCNAVMWHYEHR